MSEWIESDISLLKKKVENGANLTDVEKLCLIYYYRKNLKEFILENIYIDEIGGTVRFKPYRKQEEVIDQFLNDHNLLFVKSRQIGISTIVQAISIAVMVLYSNVTIGVLSKDSKEASSFVRKAKGMLDNLPSWIRPEKSSYEKKIEQHVKISNGSEMVSDTVNAHKPEITLRGQAIAILIVDEAAFIDKVDEAYVGMMPAVDKVQKVAAAKGIPFGNFIISTPNKTSGIGQWYFDKYKDAKAGIGPFKLVQIHWSEIEGLDETWYESMKKKYSPLELAQELDMKFIGTKHSIFDHEVQMYLQDEKNFTEPTIKKFTVETQRVGEHVAMRQEVELKIYKEPIPGKNYLIGVDTATKEGLCKSAVVVMDRFTLEDVAIFVCDIEPHLLCEVVKVVMDYYSLNCTIVERNSYGLQVVKELSLFPKYSSRLYFTKKDMKSDVEFIPGLETTGFSRPLIIESLITFVKEKYQQINSKDLALQLVSLEEHSGKIKHGSNALDDLAMAFGFGCYVLLYNLLHTNTFNREELETFNALMVNNEMDINKTYKPDNVLPEDDDWSDLFK